MKVRPLYVFFTLLTCLALGGRHDFDFEYWSNFGMKFAIGPVSPEQAKQAIINWAGRANLQIELAPIYHWEEPAGVRIHAALKPGGGTVPEYISWYAFGVKDPNPDNKYSGTVYVDSYTGSVMRIDRGFGEIREDENIANMLTPQQALNKAKEAILSYFPNIPIETFSTYYISPEITEDGSTWKEYRDTICFAFQKRILTPNGEEVDINIQRASAIIDSNTGEPLYIDACYEPLEISPIPTLTREQLAQAVTSFFLGLGAQAVYIPELGGNWFVSREEPNGTQRLCLGFLFGAEPSPEAPSEVKVLLENLNACVVDAHTGEVFSGDFIVAGGVITSGGTKSDFNSPKDLGVFFNGLKKKLIYPIINRDKDIYISSEDLNAIGFRLRPKGKNYVIYYKDRRGNRVEIGKEEWMEESGGIYISVKTLGRLKGIIARYIDDSKTIYIAIIDQKAYDKGRDKKQSLKKEVKRAINRFPKDLL